MDKEELQEDDSVRGAIEAAMKESAVDETPEQSEPVREEQPEAEASKPDEKPEKVEAADKGVDDEKSEDKPLDPPNRWTKKQKEWFAGLDPKFQAQLIEHDKHIQGDYTRKTQEMAQARQRYGGIEEALAPRREEWQRMGWDDTQAINNILQYWDFASQDPLNFIDHFARERGIDLASHFAPSTDEILQHLNQQGLVDDDVLSDRQNVQLPPQYTQQLEQLAQQQSALQNQLAQQQALWSQQQNSAQEAERQSLFDEISRFANQVDEQGKIKHEFFEDVRDDMSRLLKADMAEDLTDAYEKAIALRPDVRERIEETQAIARERQAAAEAERARKASLSLPGSSTQSVSNAADSDEDLSVGAILRREWQKSMQSGRI